MRMQVDYLGERALSTALAMNKGITAFVGGGGKTSAMLRLARELSAHGRVIVATTTHIWPPDDMPVLHAPDLQALQGALARHTVVCVGSPAPDGKLTAFPIPPGKLCALADYVLIEADGARGLPLKAPAGHEPVIPTGTGCVVAVAGLDGVGKPIRETAFRPERYAALLGVCTDHAATPHDIARVLCSDRGQHKDVRPGIRFCVLLNKADDAARIAAAHTICETLHPQTVERAVIACLLPPDEAN